LEIRGLPGTIGYRPRRRIHVSGAVAGNVLREVSLEFVGLALGMLEVAVNPAAVRHAS